MSEIGIAQKLGGARGRKMRRLPPVVLKAYLPEASTKKESSKNAKREEVSIDREEEESTENVKCSECDRSFDQWSELYQHCEKEHSGLDYNEEDDIEPDEKKPIDVDGQDREEDEPSTDGRRPAQGGGSRVRTTWCDICKKHLATVSSRNLHMRIHTGERPFVCPFCTKSFTQNVHLRSHMSVHTGAKPYVCDVCGKGFVAGRTLKIHMMSHTKDVPHVCQICNRRFLLRNHLQVHMQTHHPDEVSSINAMDQERSSESMQSDDQQATLIPSKKYRLMEPQHHSIFATNQEPEDVRDRSIDRSIVEQVRNRSMEQSIKGSIDQCIEKAIIDRSSANRSITNGHHDDEMDTERNGAWDLSTKSESIGVPTNSGVGPKTISTHSSPTKHSASSKSRARKIEPRKSINTDQSSSSTDPSNGIKKFKRTSQTTTPCANCSMVESELKLLKNELSLIKQFLGNKLSLMEQKIDNIHVLLK